MLRVGERLKLTRPCRGPFTEIPAHLGLCQNLRQKFCLAEKRFGRQAAGFAGFLNGGKIDVRREILTTGISQDIVADMVL
jgi:hypothetical protein